MSKTILAVWNAGSKGKTETLREFANRLIATYPHTPIFPIPLIIPVNIDFRLVVEIGGIIVGVESQGDPNTNLEMRLLELTDVFNCDIILCTTRTRGETVHAVDNVADSRGYQTIWTSTYQIENAGVHNLVNNLKGQHILELLQRLSLI